MYWRKEFYAAQLRKPVDLSPPDYSEKSTEKEKQ